VVEAEPPGPWEHDQAGVEGDDAELREHALSHAEVPLGVAQLGAPEEGEVGGGAQGGVGQPEPPQGPARPVAVEIPEEIPLGEPRGGGERHRDLLGSQAEEPTRGARHEKREAAARRARAAVQGEEERRQVEERGQARHALHDEGDGLGLQRVGDEEERREERQPVAAGRRDPMSAGAGAGAGAGQGGEVPEQQPRQCEDEQPTSGVDQQIHGVEGLEPEAPQVVVEGEAHVGDGAAVGAREGGAHQIVEAELRPTQEGIADDVHAVVELELGIEGVGIGEQARQTDRGCSDGREGGSDRSAGGSPHPACAVAFPTPARARHERAGYLSPCPPGSSQRVTPAGI
jgi:hypothetical protein